MLVNMATRFIFLFNRCKKRCCIVLAKQDITIPKPFSFIDVTGNSTEDDAGWVLIPHADIRYCDHIVQKERSCFGRFCMIIHFYSELGVTMRWTCRWFSKNRRYLPNGGAIEITRFKYLRTSLGCSKISII